MGDIKCELCPISFYCEAYHQAWADNGNSYHPHSVARVWDESTCPLMQSSGLSQKEAERIDKLHKELGIN